MLMKDHLVKYEQLHTKIKDHLMILLDIPLSITEIYCDKKIPNRSGTLNQS